MTQQTHTRHTIPSYGVAAGYPLGNEWRISEVVSQRGDRVVVRIWHRLYRTKLATLTVTAS